MRKSTLAAGASVLALAATLLTVPAHAAGGDREPEVVTGGLVGPLTLAVGNRGDVYVTQTFANTLSKVDRSGAVTTLHSLEGSPGTAELVGVAYSGGATYHIESDLSGEVPTTHIVRTKNGERTVVSDDLWAYEMENNPDASQKYGFKGLRGSCADQLRALEESIGFPIGSEYTGIVESHGYQLEVHRGTIYVADAALIHYAKETQKTALPHIRSIRLEQSSDFIALDPVTRRNLEIIDPLFEHGTSLFHLINECQTAMGSRLLSRTLMQPIRDTVILEARLDAI